MSIMRAKALFQMWLEACVILYAYGASSWYSFLEPKYMHEGCRLTIDLDFQGESRTISV